MWPRLVIAAVTKPTHCRDGVTGGVPVPAFCPALPNSQYPTA